MNSTTIHIRWHKSFVELVQWIGVLLGQPLDIEDVTGGHRCKLSTLNLDITIFDNAGFEPDAEIPFDQYSVVISIAQLGVPSALRATADTFANALATHLAGLICFSLGCPTLVVHNMQRVLVDFTPQSHADSR